MTESDDGRSLDGEISSGRSSNVFEREEARALMNPIVGDDVIARRDKALIGVMLSSFARVGAVVGMKVRDYRAAGTARAVFHLHEKGGRFHPYPHTIARPSSSTPTSRPAGLSNAPDAPSGRRRRAGAGSCPEKR